METSRPITRGLKVIGLKQHEKLLTTKSSSGTSRVVELSVVHHMKHFGRIKKLNKKVHMNSEHQKCGSLNFERTITAKKYSYQIDELHQQFYSGWKNQLELVSKPSSIKYINIISGLSISNSYTMFYQFQKSLFQRNKQIIIVNKY